MESPPKIYFFLNFHFALVISQLFINENILNLNHRYLCQRPFKFHMQNRCKLFAAASTCCRRKSARTGFFADKSLQVKNQNYYKLNNNLLTVEPRAVDPHCFDADPDPAQNLDADPDPGGGGRSAKNVHPPWQNPRYAPDYRYL